MMKRSVFSDDTTQPGALFQADDEDAARAVKAHNESLPRRSERAGEIAEEMRENAKDWKTAAAEMAAESDRNSWGLANAAAIEFGRFADRIDSLTEPEKVQGKVWAVETSFGDGPEQIILYTTEELARKGIPSPDGSFSQEVGEPFQLVVIGAPEPEKQECDQCDLCDAGPCRTLDAIHDCLGEARETIARLRQERDEARDEIHVLRAGRDDAENDAECKKARVKELEAENKRLSHHLRANDKACKERVMELEAEAERLTRGEESHSEEGDPVADALGRAQEGLEGDHMGDHYAATYAAVQAISALSDRVTRQSDLVARLGGRVAEMEEKPEPRRNNHPRCAPPCNRCTPLPGCAWATGQPCRHYKDGK
jgi:hypothetical protein